MCLIFVTPYKRSWSKQRTGPVLKIIKVKAFPCSHPLDLSQQLFSLPFSFLCKKIYEGQEDETNSKTLKIRPERSWHLTHTLLNTTVTGGRSVNVIKGEKPPLEREDGEN